ncbi:MAG: biotin/lipoyl-binding protein [Nitrospiraceae bacterium]|nr:biotin/lipoyl-binding protein [Nitrospiraceae bacterium]
MSYLRVLLGGAILLAGVVGFYALWSRREPPKQLEVKETVLPVEAMVVQPEDVPAKIQAYGEVRSLDVVAIAPQVPGRVVHINPNLEVGEVIPKGKVLFKIDPRDYEAQVKQSEANVAMRENVIERLKKQFAIDKDRLTRLERSSDLAQSEFERQRALFEKDEVGTRSGVEQVERSYNLAADIAAQMRQAVALYPVRIREAENMLASARAALDLARLSLERATIIAPFPARLKSVRLEVGQYVTPGVNVLTLANDTVLEISVSLDAREAADRLRFEAHARPNGEAWFARIAPVTCEIRWMEDPQPNHTWKGTLHRVEKFDPQTRTMTVAVRVAGADARSSGDARMPLVEGMFCEVTIPGRLLKGLYRLPTTAVNFEGIVYRSVNGRLQYVSVERAFINGEDVFISSGLNPGDVIVTTRLLNPIKNTLLNILSQGVPGATPVPAEETEKAATNAIEDAA